VWNLVFSLREEHRLRVFENRVPREIFGADREVTRDWRKLRNEELHDLYGSSLAETYRHVSRAAGNRMHTEFGGET
jgi:hypothetical protein